MSTRQPRECLRCQADLPAPATRCPACGLNHDEQTRVWRSSYSWARVALRHIAIGLLVGVATVLVYRAGTDIAPHPTVPLIFAIAAALLGISLHRILSGRLTRRFVATLPDGILVATRRHPLLVPWNDVDRLRVQRGVLKIQRLSDAPLVPLDDLFANEREQTEFRTAVDTRRRAARH